MSISVILRYIDREQVISTDILIIINHAPVALPTQKRKEDHKTNVTYKLGRAIQEIGYCNFEFGILDKIGFNDWNELYDIGQNYMIQYDRINNGWSTRTNLKKTRY